VNDVGSRHTSAATSSKKDAVYCATNVDGKRKYVVYKGKTVRARQVGGDPHKDIVELIYDNELDLHNLDFDQTTKLSDDINELYKNDVWKLDKVTVSVYSKIIPFILGNRVYNKCQELLFRNEIVDAIVNNCPNYEDYCISNLNANYKNYITNNVDNSVVGKWFANKEIYRNELLVFKVKKILSEQQIAKEKQQSRLTREYCAKLHAGQCSKAYPSCIWVHSNQTCVPINSSEGQQAKLPLAGKRGPYNNI